jgi:hypothetical protein
VKLFGILNARRVQVDIIKWLKEDPVGKFRFIAVFMLKSRDIFSRFFSVGIFF